MFNDLLGNSFRMYDHTFWYFLIGFGCYIAILVVVKLIKKGNKKAVDVMSNKNPKEKKQKSESGQYVIKDEASSREEDRKNQRDAWRDEREKNRY